MPPGFEDPPNVGQPILDAQAVAEEASMAVLGRVRRVVLPRLLREAEARGWWSADAAPASSRAATPEGTPTVRSLDAGAVSSLAVAPRTISPFDPDAARAILVAAARDGARLVGAVVGSTMVGAAVADAAGEVLALGVAPSFRRGGLGAALLRALAEGRDAGTGMTAQVGVAERDWAEPLDVGTRLDVARRLLIGAGFEIRAVSPDVSRDDPWAIAARLSPR
jgi:ribosomal protein S18 acetylase RimI-like enzyme